MSKFSQYFGNVIACGIVLATMGATAMADTSNNLNQVTAAFEALQQGDTSKTGALVKLGPDAIGLIVTYLDNQDDDTRMEAVAILAAIGGAEAAQALITGLDDKNADIRDRAAYAVLQQVMQSDNNNLPDLSSALEKGTAMGNPGAAALLLLGYVKNGEETLLAASTESRLVKLNQSSTTAPASLPADIALSRRGNNEARNRLSESITDGNVTTIDFILDVLATIDSPPLLIAIASSSLKDDRPWSGGIPGAEGPALRIMDKAVNALVNRLGFNPGFELSDQSRYSSEQIQVVKSLIISTLPN